MASGFCRLVFFRHGLSQIHLNLGNFRDVRYSLRMMIRTNNEPMQGKQITLIGGGGFLGRYLTTILAKKGAQLRIVSRHPNKTAHLRCLGEPGQIVPMFGDICIPQSLVSAIHGVDGVINLSGIPSETPLHTFEATYASGPGQLADMVTAQQIPYYIHVSSLGVPLPGAPDAVQAYAHAKQRGERAVQKACPRAIIVRPNLLFGPGDGLFTAYAQMMQLLPMLPLFGGGCAPMAPVHAEDVAEAISRLLFNDLIQDKSITLSGPKQTHFKDILLLMMLFMRRSPRLLSLPQRLSSVLGKCHGFVPHFPFTPLQTILLGQTWAASASASQIGFDRLGIFPMPLEESFPSYLSPFRKYA